MLHVVNSSLSFSFRGGWELHLLDLLVRRVLSLTTSRSTHKVFVMWKRKSPYSSLTIVARHLGSLQRRSASDSGNSLMKNLFQYQR